MKSTEFDETFRKNHCLNFVTSQKYALTLIFMTFKVTILFALLFFSCSVEIIKSLLDKINSVNLTNADFFTPLHFSAANGNLETKIFLHNVVPLKNDNIYIYNIYVDIH